MPHRGCGRDDRFKRNIRQPLFRDIAGADPIYPESGLGTVTLIFDIHQSFPRRRTSWTVRRCEALVYQRPSPRRSEEESGNDQAEAGNRILQYSEYFPIGDSLCEEKFWSSESAQIRSARRRPATECLNPRIMLYVQL